MISTATGAVVGGAIGALPGGILALPAAGVGAGAGAMFSLVSQAFSDSTRQFFLIDGVDRKIQIVIA